MATEVRQTLISCCFRGPFFRDLHIYTHTPIYMLHKRVNTSFFHVRDRQKSIFRFGALQSLLFLLFPPTEREPMAQFTNFITRSINNIIQIVTRRIHPI